MGVGEMIDFNKLDLKSRKAYIDLVASASGLPFSIIEKDLWVCWTLERLFKLEDVGAHLIFKGGTTLSKIYSVIDRFSEDIDILIDRKELGFIGDKDPEHGSSARKQQKLIQELAASCRIFVQDRLLAILRDSIAKAIIENTNWNLTIDEYDPDGQTILKANDF
jgi:predicted nucleotidyltransferase component of viral defense system